MHRTRSGFLAVLLVLGLTAFLAGGDAALAQQIPAPGLSTVSSPGAAPTASHQTENVLTTLLSARDGVAPGERFWVGLRQQIRPGWHTYWENPGDSGLPAQFVWTLPEGAQAGAIRWPAPQRFPVGPLMNYGYAGEVMLLAELTAPASARPGEQLDLRLEATWLVCAEICIPEEARLGLAIRIGGSIASAHAPAIDATRAGLPPASPWPAVFAARDGNLLLELRTGAVASNAVREVYFFPRDGSVIDHAAPQRLARAPGSLTLTLAPAPGRAARPPELLDGVVSIVERGTAGDVRTAFALVATPGAVATPGPPVPGLAELATWQALLFAFLGGIILNLMPCVFPILSMKALAMLALDRDDARARRLDALGYGAGVLASFAAIGTILLAMRSAGIELGWGFQLQSPVFMAVLCYVMLAVGLNLSGVFDLRAGALSMDAVQRGGGAFLTGLLAVVVATPCTAPFMGAALGMALIAEPPVLLAVLLSLGLGFAAPFVAVAMMPGIARLMPRPGGWMVTLRQLLAFPMYATAAWLLWVLSQQVDATALAHVLGGALCVGFAAWMLGRDVAGSPRWPRLVGIAAVAAALALATRIETAPPRVAALPAASDPGGLPNEAFSPERLAELRGQGRTVLVNMTAAWCITCLFNERTALATQRVRDAFASGGVAYLKGDWTNRDATITAYLRSFGRGGVPLYVVYRAGRDPVVLPQLLTEAILLEAIGTGP